LWPCWYLLSILVCCTKKNVATLPGSFVDSIMILALYIPTGHIHRNVVGSINCIFCES
jgi:hypothetical protein